MGSLYTCCQYIRAPLTHDDHVPVVGDCGEGGRLRADLAPVPAGRLLPEARQGDLAVAAAPRVDVDAGPGVDRRRLGARRQEAVELEAVLVPLDRVQLLQGC